MSRASRCVTSPTFSCYVTVLRLPDQTVRLPGRRPPLTPCWATQTRTSTVANSVATTNSPASRRRGHLTNPPNNTEQAKGYRERNITRMTSPAQPRFRKVVDSNGRVYRIGETDRDILGRSRAWMVWLPWAGMMRSVSSSTATAPPRSPYGRRTAGAGPRRSGCFPCRRAMAFMSSACSSHEPFPPVRAMGSQYHRTRRSTDALKSARTVLPDMRTT